MKKIIILSGTENKDELQAMRSGWKVIISNPGETSQCEG